MGDDDGGKRAEDEELLRRVLAGDEDARREFVERIRPIISAVVRAELRRWPNRRMGGRDADDIVNEIFLMLFEDDAKALRKWEPPKGFENIARIYARSRFWDMARKELRRQDLAGRPVSISDITEPEGDGGRPDELVAMLALALAIVDCVEQAFPTPLGRQMMDLLLIQQVDTDEAMRISGKTRDQVFRWRHRLLKQAQECWKKIRGDE